VKIRERYCKSVLSKSGIYGVEYAVNPYTGCQHGCIYCYAVFMKKFTDRKEPWGEFVDVKINAPTVLAKQLKRFHPGSILFSSVTDPYQPLEKEYTITQKCLRVLSRHEFPVSFLTKSDLILRDRGLIEELNATVGVTFTTVDESTRKIFEPGASSIEKRMTILEEIDDAYVFFGPILPYFSDSEEKIREALTAFEERGVRDIYLDKMNLYPSVWARIQDSLDGKPLREYIRIRESSEYPHMLKKRVLQILHEFNFDFTIGW
jgi:DNA repair photolyase